MKLKDIKTSSMITEWKWEAATVTQRNGEMWGLSVWSLSAHKTCLLAVSLAPMTDAF